MRPIFLVVDEVDASASDVDINVETPAVGLGNWSVLFMEVILHVVLLRSYKST